jgi:hypothetical protein
VTPTARSLRYLRDLGYMVAVVEKWNPGARVRQDLFGFGDLLAVRPRENDPHGEFLIVQVCDATNQAARLAKLQRADLAERMDQWRKAGGSITIHAWGKKGPRGKRKTWQLSVVSL